jgi:hypothetical protein
MFVVSFFICRLDLKCTCQLGSGVGLLSSSRRGARAHVVPEVVGQHVLGPQQDRRVGRKGHQQHRRQHRRGDATPHESFWDMRDD